MGLHVVTRCQTRFLTLLKTEVRFDDPSCISFMIPIQSHCPNTESHCPNTGSHSVYADNGFCRQVTKYRSNYALRQSYRSLTDKLHFNNRSTCCCATEKSNGEQKMLNFVRSTDKSICFITSSYYGILNTKFPEWQEGKVQVTATFLGSKKHGMKC